MAYNYNALPGAGNPGHSISLGSRLLTNNPSFRSFGAASAKTPFHDWQRHREYYLDDGNVVFLVENILYRLHRSIIQKHSSALRDLWCMPPPGGEIEGTSDDNPIYLHKVKAIDFTRLLWIIYPPVLGSCKATTFDEWASILNQAERWKIDSLRILAIKQLQALPVDPVHKIVLWARYNLDRSDLLASYATLLTRPQSLSIGEAKELGVETTARIAQARDAIHCKGYCDCHSSGKSMQWTARHPEDADEAESLVMKMAEGILRSPTIL